jgi:hypothetical protein
VQQARKAHACGGKRAHQVFRHPFGEQRHPRDQAVKRHSRRLLAVARGARLSVLQHPVLHACASLCMHAHIAPDCTAAQARGSAAQSGMLGACRGCYVTRLGTCSANEGCMTKVRDHGTAAGPYACVGV